MAVYDDDEENPPIGFEQDPEDDEIGHGTWIYSDGSRKYGKGDPKEAQELSKSPETAAPSPVMDFDALDEPGPGRPNTAPLTAEERSPLEASPEDVQALGGAAPETPEQPTPLSPQPAAPAQAPLSAPALPGARGPARYTDKAESTEGSSESQSSQSSISRTGSAQDQGEFNAQQANIAQGYDTQGQAADQGANSVVAAQQQRKNALMQMAADKEAVTAAAQASSEARKAAVIKKYQEVDSRKTDINQLWKDKGALGTTLGLLGVALRSLNATKFGGPNTALQSIQMQKQQAIQAQLDDRNSELRGLERELGSIEAAAPMLEARMNDALSKRLDAMMVDEKSATVLANAKTMKASFETEKASKMAESAKAYYGTLAQQQSQGTQLGRTQGTSMSRDRVSGAGIGGAGPKRMTPKELAEADQAWEEQGVGPVERAKLWQQNGYAPPTGKTAAEYKRDKDDKGEDGKRNEDQGKVAGVQESGGAYARSLGFVRDGDTWKPGGKKGTSEEQEAARDAYRSSLRAGGYDEKAAKAATPEESSKLLDAVPFGFLFNSDTTPEEQAARLNATERAFHPRLNPADRVAPKRGDPGSFGFKPAAAAGREYETKLSPKDEGAFQQWKAQYAPNDSGDDYDLRGAFKAGLKPSPKNGHWPDTFKKPNHETFSVESQYATGDNRKRAGHWVGDTFVTPDGRRVEGK